MSKENYGGYAGLAFVAAVALLFITMIAGAHAVEKPGTEPVTGYQQQQQAALAGAYAGSDAQAAAGASAGADSAAYGGSASAAGGVGNVSVGGSSHRSSALVFASDLPQMNYCVGYLGLGGGADGGAGFVQLPIIRHSLWMQCLAAAERSVEIQARLKCADKRYRNALSYYLPRRDRQGACIGLYRAEMQGIIAAERTAADDVLNEALAVARRECSEKLGRCEANILGVSK